MRSCLYKHTRVPFSSDTYRSWLRLAKALGDYGIEVHLEAQLLREDPTAWNADRLLRTLKRALIFCSDLDTRGRAYLLARHLSIITTEVTSD